MQASWKIPYQRLHRYVWSLLGRTKFDLNRSQQNLLKIHYFQILHKLVEYLNCTDFEHTQMERKLKVYNVYQNQDRLVDLLEEREEEKKKIKANSKKIWTKNIMFHMKIAAPDVNNFSSKIR